MNPGSLPFRSVIVERDNSKSKFTMHREKKNHTDQYVHAQSIHSIKTKIGIVKGVVDRDNNVCITESGLKEELRRINASFRKNGYAKNTIKTATRDNQV